MLSFTITLLFILFVCDTNSAGILYPKASEKRQLISLDGLWNFAYEPNPLRGYTDNWYEKIPKDDEDIQVTLMPVPSSYNDIFPHEKLRDHVGLVWYERTFFIPESWSGQRIWIRFSSVCYSAVVWINGQWATSHEIGHLPFQAEITKLVKYGENSVVVSVDNTLTDSTIPQGYLSELVSGRTKLQYTFDFFHYAGIDRSVVLYTTPGIYIDDVTVSTSIQGSMGIVNYKISTVGAGAGNTSVAVTLLDRNFQKVAKSTGNKGSLDVPEARFWWPYLINENPGYMYSLQIELRFNGSLIDKYVQPVGIRTVSWTNTSLLINGRPVYLRGFGRHEDSDIRGKGLDLPLIIRDYGLIKWIGANAYRTSHYPYAEEIMDLADQFGIMIIDECPAVNTESFSDELLDNHKQSLTELIQRDKNRPSVIMWSAANEPRTKDNRSEEYYRQVIAHIKTLDLSRPTTIVNAVLPDEDHSAQFVDIASFNLYEAWYENSGDLDTIVPDVKALAREWFKKHNKPVLLTEYGADTQEGLHILPSYIWSEEYQVKLLSQHFQAFDQLRRENFFIGEMIWNFADFKTAQTYTRVGGNKKGIFTRNRQPKASAHLLRRRYWRLAQELNNATLPDDLYDYVTETVKFKDEL